MIAKEPRNMNAQEPKLFPDESPTLEAQIILTSSIDGPILGAEPGADLIASIKSLGMLVPVIVQRIGDSDRFYIVDGRRRLKAAKKIELEMIPAQIVSGDFDHPEIMTLQTNSARRSNPVSEFMAIRSLMEKGFDQKQIGKQLGIKPAVITQRLLLGSLNPVILELLEAGHISVTIGEAAAKLAPELQEKLIEVFSVNDRLTYADVQGVKRVNRDESIKHLESLIFDPEEQKDTDLTAAISHLEAAKILLQKAGMTVNLDTVIGKIKASS
jgi:ParB/RepB/Spo0J family partition protein